MPFVDPSRAAGLLNDGGHLRLVILPRPNASTVVGTTLLETALNHIGLLDLMGLYLLVTLLAQAKLLCASRANLLPNPPHHRPNQNSGLAIDVVAVVVVGNPGLVVARSPLAPLVSLLLLPRPLRAQHLDLLWDQAYSSLILMASKNPCGLLRVHCWVQEMLLHVLKNPLQSIGQLGTQENP